jgi:two-component system, OmpR family, phosphate regulon sensor histidine kinase PhoR
MEGLLFRVLRTWAFAALGAALGAGLGAALSALPLSGESVSWPGLVLGAAAGVAASLWRDARRGEGLLSWLRGTQNAAAPRDTGVWGELAYRIERLLRNRDAVIKQEQARLQQFLSAIEASPNGVMLLDADGHIDWCNSVAAEHFGLDPQRDRHQRVTNLVREPAFVSYLQEGQFDEAVVFSGPGGRTTLSVLVRPYGDAQSKNGGMKLVLSQDTTERSRTEAMRRDFVANVSHEVSTPLTVLSSSIEALNRLRLSDAERERVLQLMGQQTERMQSLVGDLLTLAQLEGSPKPPADRWLDVAALVQRALADAQALSRGRHHISASGAEAAQIAGSENELLSAVGNLLSNAVRYTPDGGDISVHWLWRDGGGADLVVRDTGIGVTREHLPRLTERFYRVDGSRSRETGGTGLGLSIVKHAVQRHGGDVDVQSEPGKGSSFRLTFPAVRVRKLPVQTPQPEDVPAA